MRRISPQRARRNAAARKYWYRLFVSECPVCGRDKSYRERVYSKRPRHPQKRIVFESQSASYDGCLG